MKVSFDFDATLSKKKAQDFAAKLISEGHEVWVHTTRSKEEDQPFWIINGVKRKRGNDDLFEVTDRLGIPRERIVFTNHEFKAGFLEKKDFVMHLDDDWLEIKELLNTDVKGISVFGNPNWQEEAEKLLK